VDNHVAIFLIPGCFMTRAFVGQLLTHAEQWVQAWLAETHWITYIHKCSVTPFIFGGNPL
jgi:hypothetical protein